MKKLLSFLCAALLMGSTCIAAPVNNSTSTQSYTASSGYSKTVPAVKFTSAHTRVNKRLEVYVSEYDGRMQIDVYFDGTGPFYATSSDRNDYSYMVKDKNGQVWYFNL